MGRIRAIVFDVGGTLLYPADPVGETYAKFARGRGLKLHAQSTTTAFREAFKSSGPRAKGTIPTDGNDRTWWKQVVTRSLQDKTFADPAAFEAFFEDVYLHYAKADAWGIYPEVLEVLEALRDHEVDLIVLSNWDARLHAASVNISLAGSSAPSLAGKSRIQPSTGTWRKPFACNRVRFSAWAMTRRTMSRVRRKPVGGLSRSSVPSGIFGLRCVP